MLTLVMVCSLFTMFASADDEITRYTALPVQKTIKTSAGSSLPDTTFTFKMVPATADEVKDQKSGTTPVKSGLELTNDTVTISVDASTDTTTGNGTIVISGDAYKFDLTSFKNTGTNTTNYFTEAGIYRYYVYEVVPADAKAYITYSTAKYMVDLYVFKDTAAEKGFSIQNMIVTNTADATDKPTSANFTNTFATQDVTIKKLVNDDLKADGEFEFKIMIPVGGDTIQLAANQTIKAAVYDSSDTWVRDVNITVKGANANASIDENGTAFTLKNGQYLKISGAPIGMNYFVKEVDANTNGFTTTWTMTSNGVNGSKDDDGKAISEAVFKEDQTDEIITAKVRGNENKIVFTNTRTISAPTGVMMDILPYAIAVVIALAGAALIYIKKRANAR
jgi:hypothetical protein